MPQNIEWKARLGDFVGYTDAIARAQALAAEPTLVEKQRDTYFHAPRGRLKCRERWTTDNLAWGGDPDFADRLPTELIGYRRSDGVDARASDYAILEIEDAEGLIRTFDLAFGTRAIVEKVRFVAIVDQVRIHLDRVEELGAFLEFEAIVDAAVDEALAHEKVRRLREHFGLGPEDAIRSSYGDLSEAKQS